MTGELQYIRKCDLIVSNETGDALNLAGLTINFAIKKTDGQTPNTAAIRVYNLNEDTQSRIKKEFTRVTLQAGYESNYGVIFDGNVKQFTDGRENVVDHFLDIQAADGDESYNFAVVNATLAAGAKQRDQIEAAAKTMRQLGGTELGYVGDETDGEALPRGKVMYGMARDYIRNSAQSSASSWSIQNGKIQVVPLTGILPGQAVVLNSQSGLIGAPEQTNDGIKFRCLINPQLVIGGMAQINERDIRQARLDDNPSQDGQKNEPAQLQHDGFYRLITATISGNTRGNDWYIDGVCLSIDQTAPDGQKVQGQ
jgi:hypothetical protein